MGHLLVVAGPAGVGKTTLADLLGRRLDVAHLDFDEVTRALVDEQRRQRGPVEEHLLLRDLREQRYALLQSATADALRDGSTVIVSAPFTSHVRDPLLWQAWTSVLPPTSPVRLVWLDLPPRERLRRMKARRSPRDDLSQTPQPVPPPVVPHVRVDSSRPTWAQADDVLALLG